MEKEIIINGEKYIHESQVKNDAVRRGTWR